MWEIPLGKVCRKHLGTILALFKLCCSEALTWPALNSIPILAVNKMPTSSRIGNWPVARRGLGVVDKRDGEAPFTSG